MLPLAQVLRLVIMYELIGKRREGGRGGQREREGRRVREKEEGEEGLKKGE